MFDLTVPPNDIESEWRLVGACFLDHDTFDRVQVLIGGPGAFYSEINRAIWAALMGLRSQGVSFSAESLQDEMTRTGTSDLLRGWKSISSLMADAPHVDEVDAFLEIVRDKHARRQAAEIGRGLVRSAYDHGTVVADFMAKAEAVIQSLGAEPVIPDVPAPVAPAVDRWEPFPVDALPEPLRSLVAEASKAIGCDPCYVAVPALVICGAAAGGKVRLMMRQGWLAPAVLWAVINGESGSSKSPAMKAAMTPVYARQSVAWTAHKLKMDEYKIQKHLYDKKLAKWKREKTSDDPPEEPVEPRAERFQVSDVTIESMAPILEANPNGVLMAADELATWFGSFDKYSGGKGSDAAQWLSTYDAGVITVDRKSGTRPTIRVASAPVWVVGGIQPAIFAKALGTEHRQNGLAARLLTCTPPRTKRVWTEAIIDPETEQRYASCINAMYDIRFESDPDDDKPHVFTMDHEAKSAYIAFFNEHSAEQMTLSGDLLAAWSKLAEIPGRLALIFHMVRLATGDRTIANPDEVDAASMYDALTLTLWFKNEARRTYRVLSETEADRDQRHLVEWLAGKGLPVTAREVQQGCRWLKGSGEAEWALQSLVNAGAGTWLPSPKGQSGHPTRRFQLSAVYGIPVSAEPDGVP